jgi:hypothetical protein
MVERKAAATRAGIQLEWLSFASLGDARISGYLLRWADGVPRPLVVHGHGYGGRSTPRWRWARAAARPRPLLGDRAVARVALRGGEVDCRVGAAAATEAIGARPAGEPVAAAAAAQAVVAPTAGQGVAAAVAA